MLGLVKMNVNQEIVGSWERLICGSEYLNCRVIFRSVKIDCRIRKVFGSARNDCRIQKGEWRGSVHKEVYEPKLLDRLKSLFADLNVINCVKYSDPGKNDADPGLRVPGQKDAENGVNERDWSEAKTLNQRSADPKSNYKTDLDPHLKKVRSASKWHGSAHSQMGTGTYPTNLTGAQWKAAGLIYSYHWT